MSTPQMPSQSGGGNSIQADARVGDWGAGGLTGAFSNNLERLQNIIASFKPNEVQRVGDTLEAVANRINDSIELLYRQSQKMSEAWGGDDADEAFKAMNKAYEAAKEIHRTSSESAYALQSHAQVQRNWQNSDAAQSHWYDSDLVAVAGTMSPANMLMGGPSVFERNEHGKELMEQLQQHTVESNDKFPESIRVDNLGHRSGFGPEVNPRNGPGIDSGSNVPKMPGGGVGAGKMPHGGVGAGNLPDGGTGHLPPGGGSSYDDFPDAVGADGKSGTDLAGYNPPGGGGSGLGGGLGSGGLGSGGLGGGLGGGAGAGGLGAAGAGAGGMGAGGAFPGAGAAGRAGAGGTSGMPMGGGGGRGGGGDEEEHERSTWLAEDEDVWGADGDAAPPVIG
jgi:hypothetical protein